MLRYLMSAAALAGFVFLNAIPTAPVAEIPAALSEASPAAKPGGKSPLHARPAVLVAVRRIIQAIRPLELVRMASSPQSRSFTITTASRQEKEANQSRTAIGSKYNSSPTPSRSAGRSTRPNSEPRTCPFTVPKQALVKASCWTVVVPLNRVRSDGRTAQLAVARLSMKAQSNWTSDAVPVAILNGGPGDPTLLEVVPALLTSPILASRDIVLWDQRGTGASRPRLDCAEVMKAQVDIQLTANSDLADASVLMAASRACARRLVAAGADLTAFNTEQSASDVDDIRLALGISQWDLVGVSYGTALALETIRRYPDGIRRLVLDSVLPPGRAGTRDAFTADGQLTLLLTACQRDLACRKMLPDPQAALSRVVARYQADPHIVHIPASPKSGAPQRRVVLTGHDVAGLLAQSAGSISLGGLDSSAVLKSIPWRLAQLDTGNPQGLDELVRLFRAPEGESPLDGRYDYGMATAVNCHDRRTLVSREEALEIIRRTPRLSRIIQIQSVALYCQDWPSGTALSVFNTPVRSNIPTLVLAGEFDYQTPIDWSREVSNTFPQSRFVAFGTSGHALIATACGQSVVASFLTSADAKPETSCVLALDSTRFDT